MRKVALLILLGALLSLTLSVSAQQPAFCGDLPESDCAILTDAQTAMAANQSGTFDLDVNLTVSDLEGFNQPLVFNLAGTGAYSGSMSGLMDSSNLPMQSMTDPAAMVEMLGDALGAFSGELDLTLTVPPTFAGMMGEDAAGGLPLQLRLVDGVGYLNFEPLSGLLGAGLPEGWGGIDLVGIITSLSESGMLDSMAQTGMDADTMQTFTNPDFLNQFVTITRAEDATLEDGTNAAVFNTSIDYGALAASDEFNELMQRSMEAQGSNLTQEQMQSMSAAMAEAFQHITLSTTTYVGLDNNQVVRQHVLVVVNLQGMMGAVGGSDEQTAPTLTLEVMVNFGGFNEAQDITAPEGAPVLTAENLMGSGMDMGSDPMMMTPTPTPSS